jgi:ribosome-binding protein aMBF1 (putative translation factor)
MLSRNNREVSRSDNIGEDTTVSNDIRKFRQRAGISQIALAAKSGVGVCLVNKLECWPTIRCAPTTASKIARALGVKVSELFHE